MHHRQQAMRATRPSTCFLTPIIRFPDVGSDGLEEGKELLRNTRDRISEWRRSCLGLSSHTDGAPLPYEPLFAPLWKWKVSKRVVCRLSGPRSRFRHCGGPPVEHLAGEFWPENGQKLSSGSANPSCSSVDLTDGAGDLRTDQR